MIPKIFHLTHKTGSLSKQFQDNVDRIVDLYPDYEIRIHDDNDILSFIERYYPEYKVAVIDKFPQFIMVVDTVRYLWMQHFGGIYCDMDIYFQKRIDHGNSVLFVEREWTWPKDRRITTSVHNAWFASQPGHPVWQHIINGIAINAKRLANLKPMPTKPTYLQRAIGKATRTIGLPTRYMPSVFDVTGPNAISRILTEEALLQRYPDVQVLPAVDIYQAGMSKGQKQDAYTVHQTAGSWKS